MESNYNNRDFEQFVKQNADQYRMFPSDKVWTGIDKALHTRRRWYGLGLALLLLMTGAGVTWVMLTTPNNNKVQSQTAVPKARVQTPIIQLPVEQNKPAATATVPNKNSSLLVFDGSSTQLPQGNLPLKEVLAVVDADALTGDEQNLPPAEANLTSEKITGEAQQLLTDLPIAKNPKTFVVKDINHQQFTLINTPLIIAASVEPEEKKEENTTVAKTSQPSIAKDIYPLTIESVVNSFQRKGVRKVISYQLYFSPTVSYRKLSENKAFLRSAAANGSVPSYAAYNDVKNYVTHKPAIGLEIGLAAKYPLSKKLLVKAGLQFNVSRYDIRAFSNPSETATITLDAAIGSNSIQEQSTYRTRNGGNENWLQNLYYSVSIPLGTEIVVSRNKRSTFSIGTTLQPTYVISDRAYLISTDYKNYINVPGRILRRVNLNTGVEFLMGYSTKNFNWQVGPQVRYQVRSSFSDQYPVKENLFDFGLKVGVSLNK